MPHSLGVSLTDREVEIVERGMGAGEHNKSARIRQLIRLGGAVELALTSAQVPEDRREPGDIDQMIQFGAKRMRDAGVL